MTILNLDCRDGLALLPADSVDSIVCDPPYGISFMGKKWDCDVPDVDIWAECLRVLKPGGYLLAFAGTRTQHRMAVRIEDVGFEIRDIIAWVYGSGFPKHQSALKPAFEPITVARKPAKTATLLNIDACRVDAHDGASTARKPSVNRSTSPTGFGRDQAMGGNGSELGRYPANFIHDGSDEVLAIFPQTTSGKPSGKPSCIKAGNNNNVFGQYAGGIPVTGFGDSGSAARFFYCAKTSKQDRNEGLDAFPLKVAGGLSGRADGSLGTITYNNNTHPTVKPTDLMRYLCRLVTPPGGLIVDPFAGSGSTGKAAVLEGFQFLGFELDARYAEIAQARIDAARGAK